MSSRLSALISPYLAKFMKHNKQNTALLHEIVISFSEVTCMISSFNLMRDLIPDAVIVPWIYKLPKGKTYVAFINNADCPNRFSFDGYLSREIF